MVDEGCWGWWGHHWWRISGEIISLGIEHQPIAHYVAKKYRKRGKMLPKSVKIVTVDNSGQWCQSPILARRKLCYQKKRGEMLPKRVKNAQKYCQRPTSDHCILNCKKVFTWAHPPPLSLKIMYLVGFSMGVKWNKYKNWYWSRNSIRFL